MQEVLFLLTSDRVGGNSETLARAIGACLPGSAAQHWLRLCDPALPTFADLRPGGTPAPTGRLAEIAAAMQAATDIVLVAPIYWYALPAPAKTLIDHWSGWLDAPGFGFEAWIRGKRMWLVTSRADPAADVPELAEAMLRRSVEWLGMDWAGAVHACEAEDTRLSSQTLTEAATRFRGLLARQA